MLPTRSTYDGGACCCCLRLPGGAPAAEAQPGVHLKGEAVSGVVVLRPKRVKRPVMRLVLSWGPVVIADLARRWRRVVEEPGDAFLVVIIVLMAKELELVQAPRWLLLHLGAGLMMVNRREDGEQGPAVEVVVVIAGVEEVPAAGGRTTHTACWPRHVDRSRAQLDLERFAVWRCGAEDRSIDRRLGRRETC